MTCGMKQKHRLYINLILLFPPILSQSGFLDMLNLLQWFPWQLLFIVVPPRTPIIRKSNFAKGLVFAFSPPSGSAVADPGGTAASSRPPHLPHSHTPRQGQETHHGTLLRFYDYCRSQSSLFEPCYTPLATAAFTVNSRQKCEVLIVFMLRNSKCYPCCSVQTYKIAHLQSTASSVWCSVTRSSLFCTAQYHSCSVQYVNYPILYCTHP